MPPLLVTVNVAPAHTLATFGDFVIVGAVGSATTVQETVFPATVPQPSPVQFLLDSTVFVPTTAVKDGKLLDQVEKPLPLSYLYWLLQPTPPVPPLLVTVNVAPAHTLATFGDFVIVGADGSATTVIVTVFEVAETPHLSVAILV